MSFDRKCITNRFFDSSDIAALFHWSSYEIPPFEMAFAGYIGRRFALGTSLGRTAIYLALNAINVAGYEVLLPVFTCSVVRDAVCLAGAIPVFVEIDPNSLNIDLKDLKKKLTRKSKAVLIHHYFGGVCTNLEEVLSIARENGLTVIEDCAHSLGAMYKGKSVGTYGALSCFSLTKNSINLGGGFVSTDDACLHQQLETLLIHSRRRQKPLERLKQIYFLLDYGYRTIIDKVVFDAAGMSALKWWARDLPPCVPGLLFEALSRLMKKPGKAEALDFYKVRRNLVGTIDVDKIHLYLPMHSLQASIGQLQLQKLDFMNTRRIQIATQLKRVLSCYFKDFCSGCSGVKNVYMYFPLWFHDKNLEKIVEKCKHRGVLLRRSWPAFQEWWPEQDTASVRLIRDSLLLWSVNPMVTSQELMRMSNTILASIS